MTMQPNRASRWLVTLFAITLYGCQSPVLKPASGAEQVGDDGDAATATAANVRIVVEPNDWYGFPSTLAEQMTPLRMTIINNSDQPLKVRYGDFGLRGTEGIAYYPLPPINIGGSVSLTEPYPLMAPRFAYRGFLVAPYFSTYYVGLNPWRYGWAYDPFYYQRYYPTWQYKLPTRDMLELAIPEGVIEPKGQVSGFLYFPELDADEGDRFTFIANLVNASTDASLGEIAIPFRLE